MDLSLREKIALIVLSILLLAGTFILHQRHSHPLSAVTIEYGSIKQTMSIKDAAALMKERSKIDINKASEAELATIPGIGKGLAAEISVYRQKGGIFMAEEDLLKIHGIGPKKMEKIRGYVKFKD